MFIIARKGGQLGNRLILSAHFLAFAIERGVTVLNLALDEYADYFESTRGSLFCRYPPRSCRFIGNKYFRSILYRQAYRYASKLTEGHTRLSLFSVIRSDKSRHFMLDDPPFLETIRNRHVVFAQGYFFRDPSNFIRHADKIRSFFTPFRVHRERVSTLIEQARHSADLLVGVHIRQGDYAKFQDGRYFYSIDAYAGVMRRILTVFGGKRVKFLVCSDAGNLEDELKQFELTWGTGHLIEDMYALAGCDYIVGPPSSFSNWASFYGQAPIHLLYDLNEAISLQSFRLYQVPPV